MTRRKKVITMLGIAGEMSCAEICDNIAEQELFENNKKLGHNSFSHYMRNLNASLSGTLNQMVRRAEIEISFNKGPKGGKIYKLKVV